MDVIGRSRQPYCNTTPLFPLRDPVFRRWKYHSETGRNSGVITKGIFQIRRLILHLKPDLRPASHIFALHPGDGADIGAVSYTHLTLPTKLEV